MTSNLYTVTLNEGVHMSAVCELGIVESFVLLRCFEFLALSVMINSECWQLVIKDVLGVLILPLSLVSSQVFQTVCHGPRACSADRLCTWMQGGSSNTVLAPLSSWPHRWLWESDPVQLCIPGSLFTKGALPVTTVPHVYSEAWSLIVSSGSVDVFIGHVTIRPSMGHFLLMVLWIQVSIANGFRDIPSQTSSAHIYNSESSLWFANAYNRPIAWYVPLCKIYIFQLLTPLCLFTMYMSLSLASDEE